VAGARTARRLRKTHAKQRGRTVNDDERLIDPTKAVAFNFFGRAPGGSHHVEALGAGGGANDKGNTRQLRLVLTLAHR
jgi:hypothetical protein